MLRARLGLALVAGCLVWRGGVLPARAATPADILKFPVHQPGVSFSTPTPAELDKCDLKVVSVGAKGSGYVLRDPQGRLLRRLYDTVGDQKIHLACYYKDGIEVYREIDSDGNGKPDQYRWLNIAGTKWGVDSRENGHIDSWKMISAQEVGQEVFVAVQQNDFARLQALFISDAEIKTLELPAAEANRLHELRSKAEAKFKATHDKLPNLSAQTRIVQIDVSAPQCIPAEQIGAKYDLIKHGNVTLLCDHGGGKTDWLHTGELIQVGPAWRLVDAPIQGDRAPGEEGNGGGAASVSPELKGLYEKLTELDKKAPKAGAESAEVVKFYLDRADLLDKIIGQLSGDDRETRLHELADGLSAAVQNSPATDSASLERLQKLAKQYADAQPGSNLAGYVVFRHLQAEYARRLISPDKKDLEKIQKEWLETLTKFVQTYAHADDTPDALLQLGMVNEFIGDEIAAKKWYAQLAKDFSEKSQGLKATGALRRLDLEGKSFQLSAPQLATGASFDTSRLNGKVVVIYHWASWNQQCLGDFAKLKLLLDQYASKGLELVCVNLDNTAEEAKNFLARSPAPGTHLFQSTDGATGLDSPLATQYGIMVLPNLFLVGKDGKVVSRTVQVGNLESEITKLLK